MTALPPILFFVSVILCSVSGAWAAECPKPTPKWGSQHGGQEAKLRVTNKAEVPIIAVWVGRDGKEGSYQVPTQIDDTTTINTFVGHHFRIYSEGSETLLMEYEVEKEGNDVEVHACDGVEPISDSEFDVSPHREEMESLVHDQRAPCQPKDDSSRWSCIRYVSKEDYESRVRDGTVYGFNSTEEAGDRKIGETADTTYVRQIPDIPRLTNGKGYLKMSFTDKLKDILLPWYNTTKKGGPNDAVQEHRPIPGGYTNSHTVPMSRVDLDQFRDVQTQVAAEMQRVLEWWTGRRLAHTSTFGVRVYHRGSMLINHVDRADTHLASAVIQVDQVGVDEGWPLEVLDLESGGCGEVYLQPAEMVLYEGARFMHGRPMRFNGTDFANIFTHFRPIDWHGPDNSPNYDGLLDERGYLPSNVIKGGEEHMAHSEL